MNAKTWLPAVSLLFLTLSAAFAQTADLAIEADPVNKIRPGGQAHRYFRVINHSTTTAAENVVLTIDPDPVIGVEVFNGAEFRCDRPGTSIVCNMSTIPPQSARFLALRETMPQATGSYSTRFAVTSSTPLTSPDVHLDTSVIVSTEPELYVGSGDWLGTLEPAAVRTVRFDLVNYAGGTGKGYPAHDVKIVLKPAGLLLDAVTGSANLTCSLDAGAAVCTTALLSPDERGTITLKVHLPPTPEGGPVRIDAELTAREENFSSYGSHAFIAGAADRILRVTNTFDAGPGSFRQALRDSSACSSPEHPCSITFAIPGPAPLRGWFTVEPESPLPAVTGNSIVIDARTQTELTGDTNPNGPEIELSGRRLTTGNGLELADQVTVQGFALNGFPGFAIVARRYNTLITGNYIGTDPAGRRAVPNFRGIFLGEGTWTTVTNNVISGNTRSGIWSYSGGLTAHDNRIGTTADGKTPLPNGASGLFLGGFINDVRNNVIAYNGEMGVAVLRSSGYMGLIGNSIHDNGGLGIDYGLDGNDPIGGSGSQTNAPYLISATYDAAKDETLVTGTMVTDAPGHYVFYQFDVFANSTSDPEGETALTVLGQPALANGSLTLRVKGDHRGKWLTATAIEGDYYAKTPPLPTPDARQLRPRPDLAVTVYQTSEFSNSVLAQ
jgi:Right handed beta helix region